MGTEKTTEQQEPSNDKSQEGAGFLTSYAVRSGCFRQPKCLVLIFR